MSEEDVEQQPGEGNPELPVVSESTEPAAGGEPTMDGSDATELVRSFGAILSNTELYGAEHSVTKKSFDECFGLFSAVLDLIGEITFTASDETVVVNGIMVESKNPLIKTFGEQIQGLGVSSFSISKGMTREKFSTLVTILNASADDLKEQGGFAGALEQSGLDHVHAKRFVYQQVAEDEVIMSKDDAEEEAALARRHETDAAAFLTGQRDAEDASGLEGLQDLGNDAARLGDAVMEAARAQQEPGASLVDSVKTCLERAHDGLMKDPSLKTKKKKQQLTRTLKKLQSDIIARMKDEGEPPEGIAELAGLIDGMVDELRIDALADEYLKKRKAIESSEDSILRFLGKRKGVALQDSDLLEKLSKGGLTAAELEDLVFRSGSGGGGEGSGGGGLGYGGSGSGSPIADHLSSLLTKMATKLEEGAENEDVAIEAFGKALEQVDKEVRSLVNRTERKIDEMIQDATADAAERARAKQEGREAEPPKLSPDKLYELLGEIGQELCQPLAVMNCSIDMLSSNSFGGVTPQQKEMLELAATSGERMRTLIDKLIEIAGVPETVAPDADIVGSLYESDD
jgi:hypothetical protein